MNLSMPFAMQMVEELSTILSQHINFIDKEGVIIASSDQQRIGSVHMGAKKLIQENLPYIVIESDLEYPGSKQGVNLPIVVDDEIIGVIGITGEKERVEKYGEIIRKFTQMYIRDEHIKQTKAQEEKMVSRFLENWLMHAHSINEPNFIDLAHSLGITVHLPRRIVMASFIDQESNDMKHKQGQLDQATRYLKKAMCDHHQTYALRIGTRHVFMILDTKDENIKQHCTLVRQHIKQTYDWDIRFGFDAHTFDYTQAHYYYIQAKKALNAALSVASQPIMGYQNLQLELLLSELSAPLRQEFIEKLFKGMAHEDIREALQMCDVLYAHNGSLTQASNHLFIHKNTLQYKLNKLTELTGYDPRHALSIPLYSLALIFFKSL